jgi:hypothetical protein
MNPKISAVGVAMAIAIFLLAAGQFYSISNLKSLEGKITSLQSDVGKQRDWTLAEVAKAREQAASDNVSTQKTLEEMRDEMTKTRRQGYSTVGKAKQEALKSVKELEEKLSAEQKAGQDRHAEVASQISAVRQATTTAQARIADVSTDVTSVRTEVANTKSELQKTITDLRKVVGDMGVMSGLIATNSKELAALRELGDRNYFEFTLPKAKQPMQISNVAVVLRKADVNRNRYTLDVLAEDRKIEKKDKTVNEPVQFYMSRNKLPYEIVINEISKDKVKGYLATPKVTIARSSM